MSRKTIRFASIYWQEKKVQKVEKEKTQSQEEIKTKEQPLWANITGYHQLK